MFNILILMSFIYHSNVYFFNFFRYMYKSILLKLIINFNPKP